ncbi:MAG: GtrA family protein [Byssovorax sp.]
MRSALVGGVATFADLASMALLVHGAGTSPRAASPIALALGIAFQFVGNKLFAFRDARPRWGRQAAQFLLVEAIGFTANLLLFDMLVRVSPLPLLLTRVLTQSIVYFGVCLPLWSRIFKAHRDSVEVAS